MNWDWGLCVNLVSVWNSEILEETSPGIFIRSYLSPILIVTKGSQKWIAKKNPPESGSYIAFYVSMHFEDGDSNFEFTTSTAVAPDEFPFDECQGEECLGELI